MKKRSLIFAALAIALLSSCEYNIFTETTVHEDGSLEKVIVIHSDDKELSDMNVLDSITLTSWEYGMNVEDTLLLKNKKLKYKHTFRKRFSSTALANTDLATPNDTLFRMVSGFEKKNRWFYTHYYYEDVYQAVNKFKHKLDDYFTEEDYRFIDRLQANTKKLSKADSLYLSALREKMEVYGEGAFKDIFFNIGFDLIRKYKLDEKWIDTLAHHRENIYRQTNKLKDIDDEYLLQVLDSLNIPLPYDKVTDDYNQMLKRLERIFSFMLWIDDGTFQHKITMPGHIIQTNADSIAENVAYWYPRHERFMLQDYRMYAETRSVNYLNILITIVAVGIAGFILWIKQR